MMKKQDYIQKNTNHEWSSLKELHCPIYKVIYTKLTPLSFHRNTVYLYKIIIDEIWYCMYHVSVKLVNFTDMEVFQYPIGLISPREEFIKDIKCDLEMEVLLQQYLIS